MTDIVNSMLKSAEFPSKWKRSQIKPIPKVSCPSKLKDYRPVSMLFHLGKLSEQVIIDKMRSKLEIIIDPCQYAYQPNIGTVDALIQLIDDFTAQLDNPNTKFVQSAALDFSKAFDRLQPANNNMILNAEKTEIMNTCLSFRSQYDDDLFLDDVKISPSECTKFLGIFIDNKLSFNSHVNSLVSKCNARLFLMCKLKTFGLNNDELKTLHKQY